MQENSFLSCIKPHVMNKISIRSPLILSILGVLSIAFFLIIENTKLEKETDWYDEKIEASRLAKTAHQILKGTRFKNAEFADNINDPNETGLIGQEFSLISTGRGSLSIKASTVNPNFAGMVVQLLKDAGIEKGDNVAICMTGSFPALNISTLAALQTLEVNPIIISSVTASTWGATDPQFTWLDMERILYEKGVFKSRSIAASIGGNEDIGRALSEEGRVLALKAISRNKLALIGTDSLTDNISTRVRYFQEASLSKPIGLYINIGGGVASIGSKRNGLSMKSGLNEDVKLIDFPDKKGVMFQMAKLKVPIIHLLHLNELMNRYKLPYEPIPIPDIGEGSLYKVLKYNLLVVGSCLFVLLVLIGAIVFQDKKRSELGTEVIHAK